MQFGIKHSLLRSTNYMYMITTMQSIKYYNDQFQINNKDNNNEEFQ